MIFLELFWTYFKIGLFTIGGGYAMLPMVTNEVVDVHGWITQQQLTDFIAIAESTPGPFAVNLATFVGFSTASQVYTGDIFMSILGSTVATLGVVLPSFIIILIVSVIFDRFINSRYVQGFFEGVKPVVVGLVAGAALTIVVTAVVPQLDLKAIKAEDFNVDWIALVMTAAFLVLANIKFPKKVRVAGDGKSPSEHSDTSAEGNQPQFKVVKKTIHPILLIGIAAFMGILLFGVLGIG